ncbi:MAG: ferritin-like domain-containing protein [Flavobacteriales bacterium]|nr:ferritin-like domain-containing protein [Flavobacteriales bacterium]
MAKQESTGLMKLLEDQMADLYYVEKQLVKTLPKMAKMATNEELSGCFEDHLVETQGATPRTDVQKLDKPAKAKKCPAIDGILEEGKEIVDEFSDFPHLDAGLVSAAQKVEHYEIASYGSMKAWAEQLGLEDIVSLIDETLEEEKGADEKLSGIAETVVNIEADTEEDDEEEGEAVEAGDGEAKAPRRTSSKNGQAKKKVMAK